LKNRIFMHCVTPNDSIKQILPTKGLIPALRRYRSDASQILLQSDLRPRTKEFLCTALLGDATIIDTEVRADFASAGLAHILALSGLHVGLIVMLVSLTLWPLKIVGGGTVRTIIVILLLWLYAVFTGLGASVVRSVLMLSVYFGAKILQRQSSGYNSLCFAIIVILLADPASLFSIGFQLSFSAVASILLFANTINPISQRNRLAYNTMSLTCVSLSAMMGTALISCIYFHNLPVYFLLANVAITLLLPWLIGGGAILMILEWCGCNPEWLYCFIDTLYNMVEGTARWVSSLPSATICHIYLPAWILLPYTAVIALLKLWLHNRRTWTAISAIGAAGIAAACIIFIPRTNEPPTMYVTRTTYHTNIVAYTPNEQPVMITTATNADLGATMHKANRKYIHFLGRRGYDSLHHGGHRHITNNWVWNRPWLDTGLRFIALISHDSLLRKPPKQVSHALICRGYRGNIKNLNNILRPDSIVLSYDLHPKRAKRYETECDSLKIPYRNMREDGSWQFPINSR
nr:ComEC/Rec2 family competence protein [Paramuribaculum sp.]